MSITVFSTHFRSSTQFQSFCGRQYNKLHNNNTRNTHNYYENYAHDREQISQRVTRSIYQKNLFIDVITLVHALKGILYDGEMHVFHDKEKNAKISSKKRTSAMLRAESRSREKVSSNTKTFQFFIVLARFSWLSAVFAFNNILVL